ncbi:hypothetical protein CEXT_318521 [Caerostris extrusa]|uniref:Uncharacterized protein n=1 Tax=Caerostris extrusa TaxID=172846 RepID=A0AAV4MB05_CAEEX|nr:hypothetical protein CEXT_318521 [Caerostris extrusa]
MQNDDFILHITVHPKSSNIFHTEISNPQRVFFFQRICVLHAIRARGTALHYLGFNFNIERVNSPILESIFSFNSRSEHQRKQELILLTRHPVCRAI